MPLKMKLGEREGEREALECMREFKQNISKEEGILDVG
jgi:hypothetical protein